MDQLNDTSFLYILHNFYCPQSSQNGLVLVFGSNQSDMETIEFMPRNK